jgi:hypothetical protein
MIEPHFAGLPAEQNRWTELVLLEVMRTQNSWMIEALQNLEFLKCPSANGFARSGV